MKRTSRSETLLKFSSFDDGTKGEYLKAYKQEKNQVVKPMI
jgi:hypothetical protein